MSFFRILLLLFLPLLQSCAYLKMADYVYQGYSSLELSMSSSHSILEKHGEPFLTKLPYLSCWASILPLPLPPVIKKETLSLYKSIGTRIMCAFDEFGNEAVKNKSRWRHKYYIVEKGGKEGGFMNWGLFAGSRVIEIGTLLTMNFKRDGVITIFKENGDYGMFLYDNGKIKKGSPFILKKNNEIARGKFRQEGMIILTNEQSKSTDRQATPQDFQDFKELMPFSVQLH